MPSDEQTLRMRALRRVVAGHDIFVWASGILESLEATPPPEHGAVPGSFGGPRSPTSFDVFR